MRIFYNVRATFGGRARALTRELVCTGLTRARDRFTLVAANAEVFTKAIEHRTERSSALPERLAERDEMNLLIQSSISKTELEEQAHE